MHRPQDRFVFSGNRYRRVMEGMGVFLDQVRAGEVSQPTQMSFSTASWEQAFQHAQPLQPEDQDLFEAGLFFDSALSNLRVVLSQGVFRTFARTDRLVALCALLNHDLLVLRRKEENRLRSRDKTKGVSANEEIERMIGLPSGIRVTPDELLTVLVDCIVYPLDDALRSSPSGVPLGSDSEPELRRAFVVANAYRIASDLWLDCLWNDKKIERRGNEVFLMPRDHRVARQAAASEHRHDACRITLGMRVSQSWRHELSLSVKRALTIRKAVTRYDPKNKRSPYLVERVDYHKNRNVPFAVLGWIAANEDHLTPFLDLPFPEYPRLTLRTVFRVWQVLGSLVNAVLAQVPDKPGGWNWLIAHAIRLRHEHFRAVLRRALEMEADGIDEAIRFLTYRVRSDGLWQRPLVPVDDEEFLVAAAPILHGDMERVLERWLRQGGFDLESRGRSFEQVAREQISLLLRGSRCLADVVVAPHPVLVGPSQDEVDILIRIGRLVLVGEAKCQLLPSEPLEQFRFRARLKEDAEQARRKADTVSRSIDELRAVLKLPAGDVSVVPFVLSSCIRGSGYPVDGVGVVDLTYLGSLLRDGGLRTMAWMNRDGIEDPGNFRHYYADQSDAETRIPDLVVRQPVVRIFEPLVRRRLRPVIIGIDQVRVGEVYYSVSMESGAIDFDPTLRV